MLENQGGCSSLTVPLWGGCRWNKKKRQDGPGPCWDHTGQWQGQHPGLPTSQQPLLVSPRQLFSNPHRVSTFQWLLEEHKTISWSNFKMTFKIILWRFEMLPHLYNCYAPLYFIERSPFKSSTLGNVNSSPNGFHWDFPKARNCLCVS